jgi:hypothetical protein
MTPLRVYKPAASFCLFILFTTLLSVPMRAQSDAQPYPAVSAQQAIGYPARSPAPPDSLPNPAATATDPYIVCPDAPLFPGTNSRDSYQNQKYWQQDYPTLIFDAKTGTGYWLEYPDRKWADKAHKTPAKATLWPISSIFTPVVYTAEKVLIRVCGLHFNATAQTTPTTQAVPDGGPQIDIASPAVPATAAPQQTLPAPSPTAGPAKKGGSGTKAISPGDIAQILEGGTRLPTPCDAVDTEAGTAIRAFKDANSTPAGAVSKLHQLQQVVDDSGVVSPGAAYFTNLANDIRETTPSAPFQTHNLTAFNASLAKIQPLAQRLATLINAWNSLMANSDFTAAWGPVSTAQPMVAAALIDYNKVYDRNLCTGAQRDMLVALTSAADQLAVAADINSARLALQNARSNLFNAYSALDDWYQASSVSTLLILPPVSGNSLTQIAVQVTDPWVPLAPTFSTISSPKDASKAAPPKNTVITFLRKDKDTTTVTVGQADALPPAQDNAKPPPKGQTTTISGAGFNPNVTIQIAPSTPSSSSSSATPSGGNGSGLPSAPQPQTAAAALPATPSTPVATSSSVPNANYLIASHRWINFVPSGGLLISRFNARSYNVESLGLTTVTTTTTTQAVPGCPVTSGNPSSQSCPPPTVTTTSAASTANFAYSNPAGNFQESAIAGITWYPFGRDTYSVTRIHKYKSGARPSIQTYAMHDFRSRLGLFAGTSVSSLGPFVAAPAFDVSPGIQLFAGISLNQKTSLTQGIIPCTSAGTSTFAGPSQSTSTGANGVITTTSINVQFTSGCSNANATMLGGTTVPTQTNLVPTFSFGFLLNTNLLQYLGLGNL